MTTNDIDAIRRLAAAVDQHDTRAMPNGTERPGEHWNARLIREEAERKALARTLVPALCDEIEQLRAELGRLILHSVTLNTISWRIASALGDVPAGADQAIGDPIEQADRLIGELNQARDQLANVRRVCDDYKDQPPPLYRGPGLSEHGVGYNHGTRDLALAVLAQLAGSCDCESYDCRGECCGVGKCSCTPLVAEQGCDDCSVEPGERHRYADCPGNQRDAERARTQETHQ